MASLAQNVEENPRHVPWNNNDNNNTEFEGGQQNMMGFSRMKAVYEYTSYLHVRKKNIVALQENQQPGKRNTIKKYHRSNLIRCFAVMKLARCLYIFASHLHAKHMYEIIMHYGSTHSHRFVYLIG